MKLEDIISVSLIILFIYFVPFMLTLMQFLKFRIVILSCKWGARLTIQIRYPSTGILPSAILGNGGGKCV